jgi:enterochelin esterase family protein
MSLLKNSMNKSLLLSPLFLFLLTITTTAQDINDQEKIIAQQEYPTETLYNLWVEYQKDESSLDQFYNSLSERHIIESDPENLNEVTVTYFAKGNDDTEYFMQSGGPDFYGLRFRKIGDSPYYYCIQRIPSDAWFNYGINEFKRTSYSSESDLYRSSMEHVYDGAVIGPDAPLSPYVKRASNVPKGELKNESFYSEYMDEERQVVVYVPSGYSEKVTYDLVIQLDGQNYSESGKNRDIWQGWTPMPTILDNLIAGNEIAPPIVVFVLNQGNRSGDMISENFSDFIALEVSSWARENFSISDSSQIIVSGPSRAGFAAARAAFRRPEVISGVLSQSGSFYYTLDETENWPIYPEFEGRLINDFKNGEKLPVKFYLGVGLYDLGLGRVGMNRQFRDILKLKGYKVYYHEYKGGHSHLNWRHTLSTGLVNLLNTEEN